MPPTHTTTEIALPMPQPSKRDPIVEREILDRLAEGQPLSVICRSDERFPHPSVWRDWCEADETLAIAYARAREAGEDAIAGECLAIIDEPPARLMTEQGPRIDPADVHNRRLRFEGRLKLLAKWNPKRWGDKVDVTSEGKGVTSIIAAIEEGNRRVARLRGEEN